MKEMKNIKCIELRPATEQDKELLFQWANDRMVRENSFSTQQITWEEHVKWFDAKMNDRNTKMFIAVGNGESIGQIRLDIEENMGIISYSIAFPYRGLGYGKVILELLEKCITQQIKEPFVLCGKVKEKNIASQKSFLRLGYKEVEEGVFKKQLSN